MVMDLPTVFLTSEPYTMTSKNWALVEGIGRYLITRMRRTSFELGMLEGKNRLVMLGVGQVRV